MLGTRKKANIFHKNLKKSLSDIKHTDKYTGKEKTLECLSTYFRPSFMSESTQRPGSMSTQESPREGVGW